VAGYYALSSAQIELTELPADIVGRLPRYPSLPATLLGRLAVDLSVRGQGLGSHMLIDAFRRVVRAATDVASWAMLVDAIHDEAANFYEHYGFTRFLDRPSRLFLPMSTVLDVVEGVDST
jgi:GNAT superfamily N-acetyltransferase